MGFSSHEIYMILRARNEASGVLQRLARQLSSDHKNQMDRYKEQLAGYAAQNAGLRANSSDIISNARVATMAAREKIDAERGVIDKVKERVSKYDAAAQKELQSLSRAKAERAGYITMLGTESRELMRSNAVARENYKTQLDGIKGLKTANSDLYTQAATVLRKNRDEVISANDAKRRAIGASIDELRKENLAIDENSRRITKLAGTYKTRADNSIKRSKDIIKGHEDEITSLDRTAKKAVEANNVQIASNKKAMASVREEIDLHQQKLNRLEGLGQIYMMTGTAAVVAGGLMVSAFVEAGKAAADYQTAAALTFTQVDRDAQGHALVTQKAILDMGKRVAREWPVEFGSIQPALYDIFSSMDIASEQVAQNMVDNIAKAAVAGAVSMEVAGKGIIEIINAWKLPMTDAINATTGLTEAQTSLNRVNDVAFTLVKEGVGSYEQFSNSIGRSIPSAVKAGATYEDMAGGLAFLTRMGMSTAMASTSLGRAFDLVSNPKFEANMKKYGMTTRDANGNFKSMVQITNDLKGHLDGMSEGQVADFLKKVTFGAGGTVQAMRFLNHAVLDGKGILDETTGALVGFVDEMDLDPSRIGLFEKLTADMYAAKGAADIAYETMANTPTAKIQELSNQFDVLKVTIGEHVLKAIVPLVEFITILMDRFNMLSPEIQRVITVVGMVAAGLMVFGGVVMLAAGFFLMLKAAAVSASMKLGAVILMSGGIVAAFVAIIAVIVALIYYWPQISAAAAPVFEMLKSGWDAVVSAVQGFVGNFLGAFNQFKPYFDSLGQAISAAWEAVMRTFDQVLNNPFLTEFFGNISTAAGEMGPKLEGLKNAFIQFGTAVGNIFGIVVSVLGTVFTAFGTFVSLVVSGIGGAVIGAFMGLWAGVQTVFAGIVGILTGVMTFLTGVFTLNWQMMADGIGQIVMGIGTTVLGIFTGLIGAVVGAVVGLVQGVIGWFANLYDVLVGHSIIPDMVNAIIDWISKLPGKVMAFVIGLVADFIAKATEWATKAKAKANELVTGVVQFISTMPGKVLAFIVTLVSQFTAKASEWATIAKNKASELVSSVVSFMSGLPGKVIAAIASLAGSLSAKGTEWMNSLRNAVSSGWNAVNGFFRGIPGKIVSAIGNVGNLLHGIGSSIINGLYNGLRATWGKVTSFVGGIASWIRNNKGPIQKDRKLLIPAGQAILEGLEGGLQNRFGAIKNMVSDVNNELAHIGQVPATINAVDSVSLATRLAQGEPQPVGNTIIVNQEINTQEIDPVKHAADLGYEIGSRLGI